MRGAFAFSLTLTCLLIWTGEADKQTHFTRTKSRRAQLDAAGGLRAGSRAASPVFVPRPEVDVQADEVFPTRTQTAHGNRARGHGVGPRRRVAGQVGSPRQAHMLQDEGTPGARFRVARMPSSAGSPNLLASFAGKNRILVISAPHDSDGYYRLMMSLLKPDVYCELAERHVHQIVMFHQEGEMGGKVRRITAEGKVMEEPLDTALIPRLMSILKLEKGNDDYFVLSL